MNCVSTVRISDKKPSFQKNSVSRIRYMPDPTPTLFIDHAPAMGGAEGVLLTVCKHLGKNRWRPVLACHGTLLEKAQRLGLDAHPVTLPRLRRSPRALMDWWAGVQTLSRLAKRTPARLMYANTVRSMFYALPAARLARLPLVWHFHDFWLSESRPRRLWADRLLKQLLCAAATRVIANSHATAAHLPSGCNPVVVHNAIDIAAFDPTLDGTPFRARYGIPAGVPVAGMVGRLRPWKGQARFLRAMARVAEALPEARFLIAGGAIFGVQDDYEAELHRLAAELGLAGRVVFTGHLDDVRPALAALDVFVHPGDPEPFGLVNLEAMAMRKPVVAFAHGALPEIVVKGKTGLLVPPGDEAALAEAVIGLLRKPQRARELGAEGRARAARCFSVERMISQIEQVLAEVAG